MAEVTEKNPASVFWAGLGLFVGFETVVYYVLRLATSGLGMTNQLQPENTIVSNWVKTVVFLLLHLLLVVVAVLMLSNWLPRRYRREIMRWFYLSLLAGFCWLIPLFS